MQAQPYTLPGVIDFLKEINVLHARERDAWEQERSSLLNKVQALKKDIKFAESVQETLVRRVKMLEYALQHDRARSPQYIDTVEDEEIDPEQTEETSNNFANRSVMTSQDTIRQMSSSEKSEIMNAAAETDILAKQQQQLQQQFIQQQTTAPAAKVAKKYPEESQQQHSESVNPVVAPTPQIVKEPPHIWAARHSLRSHFDCVRSINFHPTAPLVLSASDDATLKLWNISSLPTKSSSTRGDLEPIFTYRGHTDSVLCSYICNRNNFCFSGSSDSSIRVWNLPSESEEPYEQSGTSIRNMNNIFIGHSDAVWDITSHSLFSDFLFSASADSSVKLWKVNSSSPLLKNFYFRAADNVVIHTPTSICIPNNNPSQQIIVSYSSGAIVTFDIETGKSILCVDSIGGAVDNTAVALLPHDVLHQPNRIISHSSLPLIISVHEDGTLKFFDRATGNTVKSLRAHSECSSAVALSPNGAIVCSAGSGGSNSSNLTHNAVLRFWDISTFNCVAETSAHRRKFGEAVLDVKYQPQGSFLASGGADSVVQLYQ